MTEPWEEWDAYCRQEEERAARQQWPECAMCGAEITDEWHYIFDGEPICGDCIHDYVEERRVQTVPGAKSEF